MAKAEGFDVKILKEIIKLRKQDQGGARRARDSARSVLCGQWNQRNAPPKPPDPSNVGFASISHPTGDRATPVTPHSQPSALWPPGPPTGGGPGAFKFGRVKAG